MKKLLPSLSVFALSLTLLTGNAFAAEESLSTSSNYSAASEDAINKKLIDIADKYEIGEAIVGEDLDFIKEHGTRVITNTSSTEGKQRQKRAITDSEKTYRVKGSASNDIFDASIKGKLYTALGIWHNTIDGDITTKVSSGEPTDYNTDVRIIGYGAVGTSGTIVGKTVDETYSSGWTKSHKESWTYSLDRDFYASVAWLTIDVTASVKGPDGSLEISND
ncbi:hypothetical protein O0555_18775 [Brevibacillus laterosporus]|uniref:hypothetical protein n=1 Tax=Brevibacillus laterosporus TaxID=1465 RepID=UPI0018CFEE4F|nr:hypothetical protein [Brevibacillus laterosporus]MBG9797696.1 hypothetical protein [Brevibacillus laterosporus]MCR8939363.1 hypothetical protein [Brevibacillus laterosporus]MCZ0842003.1 hypothetical protein [Brevibacillus laterosporus]MCZ0847725.1 hypothetical protein [Brevibacillus laterosporus]MED1909638.1 hypothetical protein [Brevibacillus laterosporus]